MNPARHNEQVKAQFVRRIFYVFPSFQRADSQWTELDKTNHSPWPQGLSDLSNLMG